MKEKEDKHGYGVAHFDRRLHPRFNVNLPIEYRRADLPFEKGKTINASEGGIAAFFKEPLEVGENLRIKLFFSSGPQLNAVELLAEIAWTDDPTEKDWRGYRAGLKFLNVSSEDLNKLKSFLIGLSK